MKIHKKLLPIGIRRGKYSTFFWSYTEGMSTENKNVISKNVWELIYEKERKKLPGLGFEPVNSSLLSRDSTTELQRHLHLSSEMLNL